jgi:hypothetical protein
VPIGDLRLIGAEHHILTEYEFGLLVASIAEDGFTKPILINKVNNVIHGRWRYRAARVLGLKVVPALRLPLDALTAYMTARRHNTIRGDQDGSAEGEILQQLAADGYTEQAADAFRMSLRELDTLIHQLCGLSPEADLPDFGNLDDFGDLADSFDFGFSTESEGVLEIAYTGLDAAIVEEVLGDNPKEALLAICREEGSRKVPGKFPNGS